MSLESERVPRRFVRSQKTVPSRSIWRCLIENDPWPLPTTTLAGNAFT
jgi:hypothetical protein